MKKTLPLFTILLFLLFNIIKLPAQDWKKNLPQDKIDKNVELTLHDYQKAFNDYWNPRNVDKGFYYENGIRKKAAGWKLFKRWEWYWEDRVDPITGEFPKTSAAEIRNHLQKTSGARNADGNWSSMGPNTTSGGYAGLGRINCVAFIDGVPGTYFVGSPSGGLWKTTNDGDTWTVLTDDNDVLGVSDILVYPSVVPGTETIYIATGDRDGGSIASMGGGQVNDNNTIGVLKSTDGGSTWSTTDLTWIPSDKKTVNKLLKHPADPDSIYATGTDGVFLTTDGGSTWPKIAGTIGFIDMEFKPMDPGILYGTTEIGEVYVSGDKGDTWEKKLDVSTGLRGEIAVTPDIPDWVYVVMAKAGGGLEGVYKSEDSGETWAKVFDGSVSGNNILGYYCDGTTDGGQGYYDLCIAADPSDAMNVFIGGINTWKSTDGGVSWSPSNMWTSSPSYNSCSSPVVHADKHNLVFHTDVGDLLECNDGGFYKSPDGGTTWDHLGSGLVVSQLYRIGVSQSTSGTVIAGLQDCGTKSRGSGTWSDVIGGDGMECFIDPTDDDTQYGELYFGDAVRTTDNWATSTSIEVPSPGLRHWVTPFAIDPITPTTIYIAYDTVWKSTDQGDTWTAISGGMTGSSTLKSMAIAPSDPDTIYVAKSTAMWATYDGGTSWSEITGTLPTGSSKITYISVNSDFADTLWVAMGEYNAHCVYQSTDAGATWTDISSGLPSIPVMCVVQNKQNTTEIELYAATDVGVYVKVGSADWMFYSEGLPNVVVTELDIFYDESSPNLSRIRAATYGRGLWESELYSPDGLAPTADFEADDLSPSVDSSVYFTDKTIDDPDSWLWTFTPATVTYLKGTSSTSQHPVVSFDDTGDYTVELTATNTYGSDTETKTDYITVISPVIWKGTTSTAWGTGSNWEDGAAPDETDAVVIPSGATFYPELTAGTFTIGSAAGTYKCKSLLIKDGGKLTVGSVASPGTDLLVYDELVIEGGGILEISDDLSLESGGMLYVLGGTIENFVNTVGGFGDIIFKSGSGGYMTSGSITVFSDLWFFGGDWYASGGTIICGGDASAVNILCFDYDSYIHDFEIDAGVKDTLDGLSVAPLSIRGDYVQRAGSMMSIPSGNEIIVFGDVLLESDATGSASLINDGTFTVYGTSMVEQFITDGQWHMISSPVAGETAASLYFGGSPEAWLKKYLEPTNTWEFITALSTPLTQGRGFAYWLESAKSPDTDETISFEGSLLHTDLTLTTFDYTPDSDHGFNLVGNPFPSAIDWDIGSWDTTDISGAIWVWEDGGAGDGTGTYLYRNSAGMGSLSEGIIPASQGFFVQVEGPGPSLTIPADARVHSGTTYYKKEKKELQTDISVAVVEVSLEGKSDEAWIAFTDEASDGLDRKWDVSKLFSFNNFPQIYLVEDDYKLSINALPHHIDENRIVKLNFKPEKSSEYMLSLKAFENFGNTELILEDLQTGYFHDFRFENDYYFQADASDDHARFLLHFNPEVTGFENQYPERISIYSNNKTIYIDGTSNAFVQVTDLWGRVLVSEKFNTPGLQQLSVNLNNSYAIVKVIDEEQATVKKIYIR